MAVAIPFVGLTRQRKLFVLGSMLFILTLTFGVLTTNTIPKKIAKDRIENDDSTSYLHRRRSKINLKTNNHIRRLARVADHIPSETLIDSYQETEFYESSTIQPRYIKVHRNLNEEHEIQPVTPSSTDMATQENFDAEKVHNLFCSCRLEDDQLLLDCYVNAYEELCKLFRHFGTVFGFVTSDVEEKIGILRDYGKSEHSEHYETIQSMLSFELKNDIIKKKKATNGSRTLLRLHRALEFIIAFLLKLRESDNHCKFSSVVSKAYDDTLAKHHPWLVRKAVHVAMYILPSRPDLLKKMGLKEEEKDMDTVLGLIKELNLIYDITQQLYAKDKLLDLP